MEKINTIMLDVETYSSYDLTKCGVYRYVEAPDFEILLCAVSINGKEPVVYDLANGEELPEKIKFALQDEAVIKTAYNCNFERICFSRFLDLPTGTYLSPRGWKDTMILALYNGLPRALKQVGEVLKLDKQKLEEGKDLIRYFCVPCKPTKVNGGRTRNLPMHAKDKWEMMKKYNKRDVETEMEIEDRLAKYQPPEHVWEEFYIDQKINDLGVMVDTRLLQSAIEFDTKNSSEISASMKGLTALENPNSVLQLKGWLAKNGLDVESLGKKELEKYLVDYKGTDIGKLLELRKMLAKSSIKKYYAMKEAKCEDDRVRGMFMFYGARTGRWISRTIQLQNLRRNDLVDLDDARDLVRNSDFKAIETLYDDTSDILSQLVRTAFIAKPGRKFVVADFSAIECRVVAWLAEEKWVLDAFINGEDIYCATAEKMFHVPVKKHGVNSELRQKGKGCVLGCSFGGGVNAMIAMGALESGMKEEELKPLVDSWRKANPHIVKFWNDVDKAIKHCIKNKGSQVVGKIKVECRNGMLFIYLPSGRRLSYVKPSICENRYGSESFCYYGLDMSKKWVRIETFGGKCVENITQAVARDVLMNSMFTLKDYDIVAHIHDELIIEVPSETSVDEICAKMGEVPSWANGLVLRADGYETKYYKKD